MTNHIHTLTFVDYGFLGKSPHAETIAVSDDPNKLTEIMFEKSEEHCKECINTNEVGYYRNNFEIVSKSKHEVMLKHKTDKERFAIYNISATDKV